MSGRYYIVILASATCREGGPALIEHTSDRRRFSMRQHAEAYGFTLGRSDDFNIGIVEDGKLIDLLWMTKTLGEDGDTLRQIAKEIGL